MAGRPVVGAKRRMRIPFGAGVAASGVAAMALGGVIVAGTGTASAATTPTGKHNGAAAVANLLKAFPMVAKAVVGTPQAASAKPLTISPHTGLKNGQSVQRSAPSGPFKANDKPLVVVECNPDPAIPQDGTGCTGPQGVPGGA